MAGDAVGSLSGSKERVNGKLAVNVNLVQEPGDTIDVSVNPSVTPAIYNLSAPTANTEVSQALSADTKQFMIRVRGNAKAQISFSAGQSGTNYFTLRAGTTLTITDLKTSVTLYVQTDKNSQIIEILEWT